MKIHVAVFVLLLAGVSPLLSQDYMELYSQGRLAVQLGNCAEGESHLNDALKIAAKGDMRKNYFPHYYLAVCATERGDLEQAQKLAKQAEGSGISFSSLAKEYSTFKKGLQAKLKEPKQKVGLAVVVNVDNPAKNITLDDLKQIYNGEKKTWEDGSPIVPVLGPKGSAENRTFLSTVCGTDEDAFEKAWNGKTGAPVFIEKNEWILRYVFSNAGAIAFFPSSGAMQQVKVLSVDGKAPTASDYPLLPR